MTRHDEMENRFKMYDQAHPEVWEMFVRFTYQIINVGFRKNYSAEAIMQRIRWETDIVNLREKNTWKINNDHTAFYARKFMQSYPIHRGYFRIREQTSKNNPAVNKPSLTGADFKEENQ